MIMGGITRRVLLIIVLSTGEGVGSHYVASLSEVNQSAVIPNIPLTE
jgi:hypothetical protein